MTHMVMYNAKINTNINCTWRGRRRRAGDELSSNCPNSIMSLSLCARVPSISVKRIGDDMVTDPV